MHRRRAARTRLAAARGTLWGGPFPIQATHFAFGYVTPEPGGGQVPWHNQEQEEMYFVVSGTGGMCLGDERQTVTRGQAVFIPPLVFHQMTNTGTKLLHMLYCCGPAGDVTHWRQELAGTLPKAGVDAPPLPIGARPQHTDPPQPPSDLYQMSNPSLTDVSQKPDTATETT